MVFSEDMVLELCKKVVSGIKNSEEQKDRTLHKNIIDPFFAVFEASCNGITLEDWMSIERKRQIQKTLQNMIGLFHQELLGSVAGWQEVKQGGIDIVCRERKIIAEIKNKFNTVKGSDKVKIYDTFKHLLNQQYEGYTAYYVTIWTKNAINKPFAPSDNIGRGCREEVENIREMDGNSFYEMVTGCKDSLYKLCVIVSQVLSDVLGTRNIAQEEKELFDDLFQKCFLNKK